MNQQSSLWSDAWRRLLANKAAVAGGLVLLILIVLAIFAPWIAPHSYSYQNLDLGAQPPSAEFFLGTDTLGTLFAFAGYHFSSFCFGWLDRPGNAFRSIPPSYVVSECTELLKCLHTIVFCY